MNSMSKYFDFEHWWVPLILDCWMGEQSTPWANRKKPSIHSGCVVHNMFAVASIHCSRMEEPATGIMWGDRLQRICLNQVRKFCSKQQLKHGAWVCKSVRAAALESRFRVGSCNRLRLSPLSCQRSKLYNLKMSGFSLWDFFLTLVPITELALSPYSISGR